MKIPKKLKIGGFNFRVEVRDRYKKDGVDKFGTTTFGQNKIWIDNGVNQEQQESTLIHEIIEAINLTYELELNHKQISGIEGGLYQVLKDNNLLAK